jgi:hypothetical protein
MSIYDTIYLSMMQIDAMGAHIYYLTSPVHSYQTIKEHGYEETEKLYSQTWQQINNNGHIECQ